jgi:hypothetical protein
MIRASTALLIAGLLMLGSCKPATDIGQPCAMTKPCVGGTGCVNNTISLTRADVPSPLLDYIALGSAGCDDLVCLRTGDPKQSELDDTPSCASDPCPTGVGLNNLVCDPDSQLCTRYADTCPGTATCTPTQKDAMGYCTHECINDQDCSSDYEGKPGMICAQVLLKDASILPPGASTYYCIDPRNLQPPD